RDPRRRARRSRPHARHGVRTPGRAHPPSHAPRPPDTLLFGDDAARGRAARAAPSRPARTDRGRPGGPTRRRGHPAALSGRRAAEDPAPAQAPRRRARSHADLHPDEAPRRSHVFDRDNPSKSSVELLVPVESLDTHNAKREQSLKSPDFFDAKQFPTLTFKSTKVEGSGDMLKVSGDLTIRGVTKPLTVDFKKGGEGKGVF